MAGNISLVSMVVVVVFSFDGMTMKVPRSIRLNWMVKMMCALARTPTCTLETKVENGLHTHTHMTKGSTKLRKKLITLAIIN